LFSIHRVPAKPGELDFDNDEFNARQKQPGDLGSATDATDAGKHKE